MSFCLLQHGASVHAKDVDGCSPLFHAACNGHIDVMQNLLDAGCSIHEMPLKKKKSVFAYSAFRPNAHRRVLKFLLRHGANINERNASHQTPIGYAAIKKQVELVKFLLCTVRTV